MSKIITTELNGQVIKIEVSEKDGVLSACIKEVEPKPKEKFGTYFKSLDTTYGMTRDTKDILYESIKSKDDYKVGDIMCDEKHYDGMSHYYFYKVVKITPKRVKVREYKWYNDYLCDTILCYVRREDGTLAGKYTRIHDKLKIAEQFSFE